MKVYVQVNVVVVVAPIVLVRVKLDAMEIVNQLVEVTALIVVILIV